MKSIFSISILLLIISCGKQSDCIEIQYDESFVAKAGQYYCFNDGVEMRIDNIINGFCPCDDRLCFWEGEMYVYITLNIDGLSYNYQHGSSEKTEDISENLPLEITVNSDNIVFESECNEDTPVPTILSTDLTVTIN